MVEEDPSKIISSILISSVKGMTIHKLAQEYHQFIGERIPFREQGFHTLEEYLWSIPHACRVNGTTQNALVIPVVNDQNKHINNMILKQKPAKKNPRSREPIIRRSQGIYDNSTFRAAQPQTNPPKPKTNINDYVLVQSGPSTSRYQIRTPSLQHQISQPSLQYQISQPSSHHQINKPSSHHQINKPSSHHQISEPSSHHQINKPINNSEMPPKHNDDDGLVERPTPINNNKSYRISRPFINEPKPNINDDVLVQPGPSSSNNEPQPQTELNLQKPQPQTELNLQNLQKPKLVNSESDKNDEEEIDIDDQTRLLILEHFNNNTSDDEDDDDIFWYMSDEEAESPPPFLIPIIDPLPPKTHESRVNLLIKNKLKILISEHPEGIWCSKLMGMYKERFDQPVNPANFGFTSVIQMCGDLPDVFHCVQPNRTDWILFDVQFPVPDEYTNIDPDKFKDKVVNEDELFLSTDEPALPPEWYAVKPPFKYPENVLHPDDTIEFLKLPGDEELIDYFPVLVAEVYDPSKFWIQFHQDHDKLDQLMNDLQTFYLYKAGPLQLNESSVRIGLFVAALFANEYHRAVIIKVFNDDTLKVFYIDYGTIGEVRLRQTCLLHRDFSVLPQQAIRARLHNIVPIEQNTMWPREASQYMLNLVKNKLLCGLIRFIDYEQRILHIILTDTTQDYDVHINDALMDAGYAALGNEVNLVKQLTSFSFVFESLNQHIKHDDVDDVATATATTSSVAQAQNTNEDKMKKYRGYLKYIIPGYSHSANK